MRPPVRIAVVAVVTALAAAPLGATEDGPAPVIETLDVSLGSTIGVSGKALFAAPPEIVATSAQGSNPTAAPGIGMDLESATVTRTSQNQLVFDIAVYDMPPTGTGLYEVVHYDWDFAVERNGTRVADFTLNAIGSAQGRQPGTLDPSFLLMTCAPNEDTGQDDCVEVGSLNGEFHEGGLRFIVPLAMIQARDGAVLTQTYGGVASSYGVSGIQWYLLGDRMPFDPITVPRATVTAGIAPAGSGDVELSPATLLNNGNFAASLPRPTEPGEYIVVVEACLGDLCTSRTTPVTIT